MNLSFTVITDIGLKKIAGMNSLRSLNLDNRQITDNGLAALTSMSLRFPGLVMMDSNSAKFRRLLR